MENTIIIWNEITPFPFNKYRGIKATVFGFISKGVFSFDGMWTLTACPDTTVDDIIAELKPVPVEDIEVVVEEVEPFKNTIEELTEEEGQILVKAVKENLKKSKKEKGK